MKLIRGQKVSKKAVRDSEVFKKLCRVLKQKEEAQPENPVRKRLVQEGSERKKFKRNILNEDNSQEFQEMDTSNSQESQEMDTSVDCDMLDQELPPKAQREDFNSIGEDFLLIDDDLHMNDENWQPKVIVECIKDVQQCRMLDIKVDEGLSTTLDAKASQLDA